MPRGYIFRFLCGRSICWIIARFCRLSAFLLPSLTAAIPIIKPTGRGEADKCLFIFDLAYWVSHHQSSACFSFSMFVNNPIDLPFLPLKLHGMGLILRLQDGSSGDISYGSPVLTNFTCQDAPLSSQIEERYSMSRLTLLRRYRRIISKRRLVLRGGRISKMKAALARARVAQHCPSFTYRAKL